MQFQYLFWAFFIFLAALLPSTSAAENACFNDIFKKPSQTQSSPGIVRSLPTTWTAAQENQLKEVRALGRQRSPEDDARLSLLKKTKSKYLIETVFLEATKLAKAMVFQRPYNKGLLKHLERRTILKTSDIKSKTSQIPQIEGLIPVDARWLGREMSSNEKREHNLEIQDLLKNKEFFKSEVKGNTDALLVERRGELVWTEVVLEGDILVEVLVNKRGYYVTGDVDILMFARQNWNPNSRVFTDGKWGYVQEGDVFFLQILSSIWHRMDPREADREITSHGAQNVYSSKGKVDYPIVVYSPDGGIYTISQGPTGNPHLNLRNFLIEIRRQGYEFSLPEEWGVGLVASP